MSFKISYFFLFLITSSSFTLPTWSLDVSKDDLEAMLNECEYNFNFTSAYFNGNGVCDNTCEMCPGSALKALYDNSDYDSCVECSSSNAECDQFKVFTTFDKAWLIRFFTLTASIMSASDDPSRVLFQGSNNFNGVEGEGSTNSWVTLHDSDLYGDFTFTDRSKEETIMLNNYQEYRHYAIVFYKNSESSKIRIGNYGLLQAYNQECTATVFEELLGIKLITNAPSSTPSYVPTDEPSMSLQPSDQPTLSIAPSDKPSLSLEPTGKPTRAPTVKTIFNGIITVKCIYNPCDKDGYRDESDVYIKVYSNGKYLGTTTRRNDIKESGSFCWNQYKYDSNIEIRSGKSWRVEFQVYDYDSNSGDDYMGSYVYYMTSARTYSNTHYLSSSDSNCRRTRLSFEVKPY